MKLHLLAFLFASVSARSISQKNGAKVLRNARRLNDGNDADEDEYAFLGNYKLKLRSCIAGEAVRNAENGEYEYNAVVFRLCPSSGDCNDETSSGCKEGYGDYVVGLRDFVEGYMEDQRENMQYDDNFNVEEYAECREYENENQDDGNGVQYWIGPACTEDGTDVKLELFTDEACTYVPEDVAFEDISNGWSMPYGDGGLVSSYCTSCTEYDDDGNQDVKEFCQRLYENSQKCETEMETYSYYGKQEGSCEYIQELLPAKSSGGGGVAGWIVFIVVVAGLAGYVVWWRKKKAAGSGSDGQLA